MVCLTYPGCRRRSAPPLPWAWSLLGFQPVRGRSFTTIYKTIIGHSTFQGLQVGLRVGKSNEFYCSCLARTLCPYGLPIEPPFSLLHPPIILPIPHIPLTLHPLLRLSRPAYFYNPLFYAYVSTICCRNEVPLWSNAGFGRFVFVPYVWPFVNHSDHFKPYYAATGRRFLTGHAF